MRKLVAAVGIFAIGVGDAPGGSWAEDIMYFVMTDRFHDGDAANNTPEGCDPSLDDPAQAHLDKYHGGDLRGLELAVASGYFNALGVTALWITPPVRNVWRSGYDLGGWKSGYHGYWAQDFLDIDPHLTSAVSLSGKPYPDGAEGRMQHYRDFVQLAHSKGIKVIQDAVLNHAGPVFYYDMDGDSTFDVKDKDEWVQPFQAGGFYDNARWGNIAQWNLFRPGPRGPVKLLGRAMPTTGILGELEAYGRKGFSWDSLGKSDGEEVVCDFFSLRDLWTDPDSDHFDRLVDEFVTIYHFYLTEVGVDGLRIDTVKHVHHAFWDAFTERLRRRLGARAKDKLLFGEVFDGNPAKLGQYTWRSDAPTDKSPCLDSVLAFQLCFAMRDYLRQPGGKFGTAHAIEGAIRAYSDGTFDDGRPFFNPTPGPDGLNAVQKSITFIENHDSINRFRAKRISERRNQLAQALVMTLPGIPCLYYGSEVSLHDVKGRIGEDGETGRMTLWKRGEAPTISSLRGNSSFQAIQRLSAAWKKVPALRMGGFRPLWVDSAESDEDNGIFAFGRSMADPTQSAVVVFNLSDGDATTGRLSLDGLVPAGAAMKGYPVIGGTGERTGTDQLSAPPESVMIYRPVRPPSSGGG